MTEADIKKLLDARLSRARAKELLIELVKVPSPQTELLEDEPLLQGVHQNGDRAASAQQWVLPTSVTTPWAI